MIKKILKKTGGVFGINEVRDDVRTLSYDIKDVNSRVDAQSDRLAEMVEESQKQIRELEAEVRYLRKQSSLQYESLANIADGRTADSRRRFYETISPAYGEGRIYQLGCAKLLFALAKICQENGLELMLHSGTLIGAVRHHGFVPWDDDIDTVMMRDDIEKLRQILSKNQDYQLVLNYDYWGVNKQLRFRTKDPENPCFVDVFIHDYSDDQDGARGTEHWVQKKEAIIDRMEKEHPEVMQAWRKLEVVNENDDLGKEITKLFEQYIPAPKTPKDKKSYAVVWGLDNRNACGGKWYDWAMIYPAMKVEFEGHTYLAPHDTMRFLDCLYGDIYELPDDLVSHFKHTTCGAKEIAVIKRFLDE